VPLYERRDVVRSSVNPALADKVPDSVVNVPQMLKAKVRAEGGLHPLESGYLLTQQSEILLLTAVRSGGRRLVIAAW